MAEHFDVIIVGAGLSGIGAACHLTTHCPEKSFAILEGRDVSGGTWDLFRYPGVRSDSDMYTLGYRFRPWRDPKAIADGPSILNYIRDTAIEYGVDKAIRYSHRVRGASWSSSEARWTVEVETGGNGEKGTGRHGDAGTGKDGDAGMGRHGDAGTGRDGDERWQDGSEIGDLRSETRQLTCNFLFLCTGYYDYENGYTPEWRGVEKFRGTLVHPQKWPDDLDYANKRIVVIGSGATAITLVPALAERAAHVTMLQRSPSYIVMRPSEDIVANAFRRCLPDRAAYLLTRWKNVLLTTFFYNLARKRPKVFKRMVAKGVRRHLGNGYDSKHFTPPYNPWDQRLCIAPDADFFRSIRDGRVSVVTDHIETFTEDGLLLKSGQQLDADIIVTATGLQLKLISGMQLVVDGRPVNLSKTLVYKGMMFSDVPNLAFAIGYTNASWTLKCDLTSEYVCRVLNHMDHHGYEVCTPRLNDPDIKEEPVIDFNSGYVLRALPMLPSQGSKMPWRLHQNYMKDLRMLRYGRVDDSMEFESVEHKRQISPTAGG
ncbi:MAG TPA: NAD(P)/FAD-dependent oxidoreductase [Pyrinomonadaceae bacterium]|nr:NAD(P)/FAD-dependent oxidoreductase [Pyrinomonadaceae bacterium]